MSKGDRFWTMARKREAVNNAEAAGMVADSVEVRIEILKRVDRGEITLEQAQKELAVIKRNAKKNGKVTRAQAFSQG